VFVVIGVVGVAVLGLGGFWYANQSTARAQIVAALDQLDRAGVKTTYEDLDIAGFPTAYKGVLHNLNVRIPSENITLTFPEVSAGMALTSIGTVDFTLPPTFTAQVFSDQVSTDPALSSNENTVVVTSDRFVASMTPVDQDDIDMTVSANKLRFSPEAEAVDFLELRRVKAGARIELDNETQSASIDASFSVGDLEARKSVVAPAVGTAPSSFIGSNITGMVKGAITEAKTSFSADRFVLEDGMGSTALINGLILKANLTPEIRFDIAPLFNVPGGTDPTAGLMQIAFKALVERGVLDIDFDIAKMDAQFAMIPGEMATVSFDRFDVKTDISPNKISYAIKADQFKIDAQAEQRGTAAAVEDLSMRIDATPGGAFDFSPLLTARNSAETFGLITNILQTQIAEGGGASVSMASSGYETIATGQDAEFGLSRFESVAGANETAITVSSDSAAFIVKSDGARYTMDGSVAGTVRIADVEFSGSHPLKQSEGFQSARLFFNFADIDIDERLWSMLALGGPSPERIPGLRLDAEVDVTLMGDLLRMPPFLAVTALNYERISIKELLFDALGFKAEAAGIVQITPLPAGSVLLTLDNWPQFFDRIRDSALGQDPQVALSLLAAKNWLKNYGEVGDGPNTTIFNIEVESDGIQINGRPFQG
jgi:hypothetical protein